LPPELFLRYAVATTLRGGGHYSLSAETKMMFRDRHSGHPQVQLYADDLIYMIAGRPESRQNLHQK
jgi:hypothetical protein